MNTLDVLFAPAEFEALTPQRLRNATCVVFDILRATSTLVTALAHGARAVLPVQTIEEALRAKAAHPGALLAGERDGYRITAKLTGSIDFDLGNSPREFTPDKVSGKTIITTTTNGTRALKACQPAAQTFAGSFLNLRATADRLREASDVIVVCSGTHEEASLEDTLAAGALAEALWPWEPKLVSDSAQMARMIYQRFQNNLSKAMTYARNGRRLLEIPELRDDIPYCLKRDLFSLTARMRPDGTVSLD